MLLIGQVGIRKTPSTAHTQKIVVGYYVFIAKAHFQKVGCRASPPLLKMVFYNPPSSNDKRWIKSLVFVSRSRQFFGSFCRLRYPNKPTGVVPTHMQSVRRAIYSCGMVIGRWMVSVVPLPGSVSTSTWPACRSTTALTMLRPSPMPCTSSMLLPR